MQDERHAGLLGSLRTILKASTYLFLLLKSLTQSYKSDISVLLLKSPIQSYNTLVLLHLEKSVSSFLIIHWSLTCIEFNKIIHSESVHGTKIQRVWFFKRISVFVDLIKQFIKQMRHPQTMVLKPRGPSALCESLVFIRIQIREDLINKLN